MNMITSFPGEHAWYEAVLSSVIMALIASCHPEGGLGFFFFQFDKDSAKTIFENSY